MFRVRSPSPDFHDSKSECWNGSHSLTEDSATDGFALKVGKSLRKFVASLRIKCRNEF